MLPVMNKLDRIESIVMYINSNNTVTYRRIMTIYIKGWARWASHTNFPKKMRKNFENEVLYGGIAKEITTRVINADSFPIFAQQSNCNKQTPQDHLFQKSVQMGLTIPIVQQKCEKTLKIKFLSGGAAKDVTNGYTR